MMTIELLQDALAGESLPSTLARLLRLPRSESDLLRSLLDAGDAGLSPEQLRVIAPSVHSPSLVAAGLNRKLAAAGLAVRVTNVCARLGRGRQMSTWRLIDEPLNDAAA